MARSGFFYPRLVWEVTTLDFDLFSGPNGAGVVANTLVVDELALRGQNVAIAGAQETLFERDERRVTLTFMHIDNTLMASLRTYWNTWAKFGKQAALTLDRLNTCGGQYEFDQFNTFFTKAELQNNPWAPRRALAARALYQLQLVIRQGV